MGDVPRKVGTGLQGQGEEAGFSLAGSGKASKGPEQRGFRGAPLAAVRRRQWGHVDVSDQPDSHQ